MSKGGVKVLV